PIEQRDRPVPADASTVNFDNPAPPGSTMSGVFQGIDFGTGQWLGSGPYNVNPTNHIYFADSTGTSRSFQFAPAPRVLQGMRVYSTTPGTLTLSDDAGQTHSSGVHGIAAARQHRVDPALDHSDRELHQRVGPRRGRHHLWDSALGRAANEHDGYYKTDREP